jgi:putative transposase
MQAARSTAQTHPQAERADAPADWIAAERLGISKRHARRLFDQLAPLGAARRLRNVLFLDPTHPDVAKRIAANMQDDTYADLSGYTTKQIEAARRKIRILLAGREEIARKMARAAMGRRSAVEWFCVDRCPELFDGERISSPTFYRWDKLHKRAGKNKLAAFLPARRDGAASEAETCSEEAWSYYLSLYLDERKRSIPLCYDLTAERARQRRWTWPALRTIQLKTKRDIPEPTRIMYREGRRAFETRCVPRIRRSYDHVAAGDVWCADECHLDLFARAPDGRGGWKRVRPILTAWLDIRSRVFVGWTVATRANSDSIVAAFKVGVQRYGPPVDVVCDNGEDYKSVGGRSRKWASFDRDRLSTIYGELGIGVHWATPYTPWAKMIESHFRAVHERFDKLFDSYVGGNPQDRPEDVDRIPLDQLPTVEEVAEQFGPWLDAHHARPQRGDAMYGLSPAQAMQQFRTKSPREAPSAAFLDFICAKVTRPVKVTRDGVRYQGIQYGQGDDALLRRQGERVLLRVQPERADFVDVCDLDGRPICRAEESRLCGVTQDDIRTSASRRKRARRIMREAHSEHVHAVRHTSVSAAIEAQRNRNRSQQRKTPPPEPPTSIKPVRPDLRGDVEKLASDVDWNGVQKAVKRMSRKRLDFAEINRALDLSSDVEPIEDDRPKRRDIDVASVLSSGSLEALGSDGAEPGPDVFRILERGGKRHARRKRA